MSERNRTENPIVNPDDALAVERFAPRFFSEPPREARAPGELDGTFPLRAQWTEADRGQFRTHGRILQIWLGRDRDINFGRYGPRLGELKSGQFLIADAVLALPPRKMKDRHGRVREAVPRLEQYASRRVSGYYVIEPIAEILYEDLDSGNHWHYLYLGPDAQGRVPVLLYEPRAKRLLIYGQGTFRFG